MERFEFQERTLHPNLPMEFFLNGAELSLNSVNSGNLINYWSMNLAQFKDPVSHTWLAGGSILVSYTTHTGSSPFNDKHFLSQNSVKTLRKNSNDFDLHRKLPKKLTIKISSRIVNFQIVIAAIHDQYCGYVTCHLPAISTDKFKTRMIEVFTIFQLISLKREW